MLIRKPNVTALLVLLLITGGVQAGGDPAKGKTLINDCISCHGPAGKGSFESPKIAGLDGAFIEARLKAFSSGESTSVDGIMHLYTEDLDEQGLADLAAYWASLDAD